MERGCYKTILVVGDADGPELVGLLEQAGFTALVATDVDHALDLLVSHAFCLALLDARSREEECFAFAHRIAGRDRFETLPMILLGASAFSKGGTDPFAAGFADVVASPVNRFELMARINAVLERKSRQVILEAEVRDRQTLLEISRSINSELESTQILKQIVQRVASLLDDIFRCSIVFVTGQSRIGQVVASSDSENFSPIDIDLDKYPEIGQALTSKKPVVIDDVGSDPIMQSALSHIDTDRFNTVIVLPVIYKNEALGVMLVSALRSSAGVSEEEVHFCELVANVSASALYRAESLKTFKAETAELRQRHEQVKDELSAKAIYELLFENASEGLVAIDPQQNILYVNRRAMEITGYSREELQQLTFMSLLESESRDRFVGRVALPQALSAEERTFDVAIRSRSNGRRILSISVGDRSLARDLQILAFRDVTERHEMEHQLHQAREDLEVANRQLVDMNRLRTEFYNTAAHELRTPIAVVNGYCELLALSGKDKLSEKQRDYLEHISRSGDRLIDLIHNLLDLSRFELGKMPVELAMHDLSDLLREVGHEFRSLVDTQGIIISVHSGPLTLLSFDNILIRRLLVNLVSNAVKHTAEGGSVSLTLEEDPLEVRVTVRDTGDGIAVADQPNLFKEFTQISSSSGQESTGLGLAISKKIIEAHNGRIWVESAPGQGSAFTFSLPKLA